jgi:3-oxoadipate enol-lactonase
MAALLVDGRTCFYRLEGERGKPVLVLAHPVGADHGIWDQVVPACTRHFQVLRYDLRGHGASSAGAGDCSVAML